MLNHSYGSRSPFWTPDHKKKHWRNTFAYKTVTETIPATPITDAGYEWSLPGERCPPETI